MDRNYNRNALDLFRIIATVQVFLGHVITHFALPQFTDAVYFLRGVPILFVLCGFLAAKSLDKYGAKEYWLRRGIRILPGFWGCILINTLIIFVLYQVPSLIDGGIYAVTQFLGLNFYTGGWLRGYGVGTPNGVLWTIGVQLQFFLLAPMLYQGIKKAGFSKTLIVIGIFTLISIVIQRCEGFLPEILFKLVGVTVLPYLYFLLLGMAGWCYRDRLIPALEKVRWLLLAVYILWKLAENHLGFPHILDGVMYNTVTTLLVGLLVFAFGFSFKWRMKQDLTYGFYLYHMVFINIAVHFGYRTLGLNLQSVVVAMLITVLPLVFAWLSQKLIENPVAKLAEKKEGV